MATALLSPLKEQQLDAISDDLAALLTLTASANASEEWIGRWTIAALRVLKQYPAWAISDALEDAMKEVSYTNQIVTFISERCENMLERIKETHIVMSSVYRALENPDANS